MPRILHITCDYGDRFAARKTPAVSNLVRAAGDLEHVVFSLNRSANPLHRHDVLRDEDVFSLRYFGMPAGLGLRHSLETAAAKLSVLVREHRIDVDIVHSHKLTFEGPVGRRVAETLGCPYVLTVRGDTDLKVLTYKRSYRNWYRSILSGSDAAFFVAPWTERELQRFLPGAHAPRSVLLPNIVDLPDAATRDPVNVSRIVSVFHLEDYRRKNLVRLLDAVDECWETWRPVYLDIIGGGTPKLEARIEKIIRRQRHPEAFRMLGHADRDSLAKRLPGYAALVVPSRRETFGMVYLEALMSGIPFLQSANTGLDGYFDDDAVSIAVDHESTKSIAAGIRFLLENNERLRANVDKLRRSGGLDRFSRDTIVRTYTDTIADILDGA